ncbi:MAG: hypothetical protein KDB74_07770 [Flavobacteriales bacterium]|nr:hypothetical protein [Flavobacteriales bacterium]
MPEFKTQIESIRKDAVDLIDLHIKQVKFDLIERIAEERAKFIFASMATFAFFLVAFLGSIFFALIANEYTNSNYLGYGIIAAIWTILFIFGILFKSQIKSALFNRFINKNIPSS